jgi:hypothetical protein
VFRSKQDLDLFIGRRIYPGIFFFFLFLTHFAKNLGNHGFNRYAIGNRGFNEESSSSEKGGTDQKLWFLNQIITMATHQK